MLGVEFKDRSVVKLGRVLSVQSRGKGKWSVTRLDLTLLLIALALVFIVAVRRYARPVAVGGGSAEVRVKDLIHTLADELRTNERELRQRNESGLFLVSGAEIEVAFVLKESRSVTGGATVSAVALKAGEEHGKETQHRIKVLLKPVPSRSGIEPPETREESR